MTSWHSAAAGRRLTALTITAGMTLAVAAYSDGSRTGYRQRPSAA